MTDKPEAQEALRGFPPPLYEFFFKERGDRLLALYFRRNGASIEDSEDLVQDAILKAVQSYPSRRADTPLKPWIWAISRSLLIDSLRGKSYRPESIAPADATELLDRLDFEVSEEDRAIVGERESQLRVALEHFAKDRPEAAGALYMYLTQDLTLSELAGVLGRSPGATREYISQLRKQLGKYLQEAFHVK